MTRRDDRPAEMYPDRDADMAFDALVRGQDPGDAFRPLTIFADDVRLVTDRPAPGPSPALAVLLRGTATAPAVVALASRPHRPRASWSSRAVARGVGMSVAAKAALAAAIAATGVAAAGAAGVLPEPVDRAVRSAVELITPFDVPAHAGDASGRHDHGLHHADTGGDSGGTGTTTAGAEDGTGQDPATGASIPSTALSAGPTTAGTHGPPSGSLPEAGSGASAPAPGSGEGAGAPTPPPAPSGGPPAPPGPPPQGDLGASSSHAPGTPGPPAAGTGAPPTAPTPPDRPDQTGQPDDPAGTPPVPPGGGPAGQGDPGVP